MSIGQQNEGESVRYVVLEMNVEVYPCMENWEQEM